MADEAGFIRGIVSRITRAGTAAFSSIISPFVEKGTKITKDAAGVEVGPFSAFPTDKLPEFDEILKVHSPGFMEDVKDVLKAYYEKGFKTPFSAWYDFVLRPAEFSVGDAAALSTTLIPATIAATMGIGFIDTIAQALPIIDTAGISALDAKMWSRLGLGVATAATIQSPVRIGLFRNLDYFYNDRFRNQKLALPQAYDGVRYREFMTESEWAAFEGDVDLPKPVEEMTPEEISAWAAQAARAVDSVEVTNTARFMEALRWLGYKQEDMLLQDRAAKHAPSLMMLRQMAMRGFFDPIFMARSVFKGGFDNWAIKPMLNFLAYMAQEGTWVGYRDAAQSAFVKGLIDEAELRSILHRIHIPKMLEDPIVATQKLKMVHTAKDLTATQLTAAYIKGAITREECFMELKGLGYTSELAEILIKTKESTAEPSVRLPTLAQFSRAFREGIITEEDFRAYLDKRGYETKYVDLLIDVEKAKFPVIKPKMTLSNLGRAFREGLISDTVLRQRLAGLGYSDLESNWIRELYTTQAKISTASLSKAEILKAWVSGLIDFNEASERLTSMGYNLEDIELLFSLNQPEIAEDVKYISESVSYKLWDAGLVNEAWVRSRLKAGGYKLNDVDLLIAYHKTTIAT